LAPQASRALSLTFSVKLTLNNANQTLGKASESREVLDGEALTG